MHSAINNMEYVTVASSKFIPTTCPSTTHSHTYSHFSLVLVCMYQHQSSPHSQVCMPLSVAQKDAFTYCKRRKAGRGANVVSDIRAT